MAYSQLVDKAIHSFPMNVRTGIDLFLGLVGLALLVSYYTQILSLSAEGVAFGTFLLGLVLPNARGGLK